MNQGLDAASGEYIGIVEPDDYVPLNMYEDLYKMCIRDRSGRMYGERDSSDTERD